MRDIINYKFFQKLKALNFIDEIWLFGSRARGDNNSRSDIDLALVSNELNDENWLKVCDIIDDADTLLKIDCVKFDNNLSNALRENIINDKVAIYVKDPNQI